MGKKLVGDPVGEVERSHLPTHFLSVNTSHVAPIVAAMGFGLRTGPLVSMSSFASCMARSQAAWSCFIPVCGFFRVSQECPALRSVFFSPPPSLFPLCMAREQF